MPPPPSSPKKGYRGASTKAIADRLMVRQGSLYYYFSSKEAALEEVCYRGVENFFANLGIIAAAEGGAAEKVRRIILAHLAPLRDQPGYMHVFLNQRQFLPPQSRRKIGALSHQYEQLVERIIQDGIDAGVFRADLDARLAALALIGMGNSAVAWLGKRTPMSQIDAVASSFAAMFLAGIEVRSTNIEEKET